MARNEEKHFARLNRLFLQQQREEYLKRHPPRPKLSTLYSAADIKKWLPSIKRDIDFNIKQSQVPCYPEQKVKEFMHNVDRLRYEYQAFVRKLRSVHGPLDVIPWTNRPYKRKCAWFHSKNPVELQDGEADWKVFLKGGDSTTPLSNQNPNKISALRKIEKGDNSSLTIDDFSSTPELPLIDVSRLENEKKNNSEEIQGIKDSFIGELESKDESKGKGMPVGMYPKAVTSDFTPISTPILQNDHQYEYYYGYGNDSVPVMVNVNKEMENKSLEFRTDFVGYLCKAGTNETVEREVNIGAHSTLHSQQIKKQVTDHNSRSPVAEEHSKMNCGMSIVPKDRNTGQNNVRLHGVSLGLPYSDSSDEDTEEI